MIRFPNIFFSPDGSGGSTAATTAEGGKTSTAEGGKSEHWTGQHEFFKSNPDAVKSFQDFKTPDDAFKAHVELRKQLSQPFRLPKDGAKLTAEQQAEIDGYYRKAKGIPEAPEGYEFDVPEGTAIDEQAMGEYRKLAHERGIDPQTAKDLLGLQLGMVKRLNDHREKVIQGMTDNNYKTFLNEDCGGDKDVAAQRLEQVKQFLQTQFTKDGTVDTEGWEKFRARIMHGDRIIELPLLRALHHAAQMSVGTGGAMPGGYNSMARSGKTLYAEMRKK